MAERLAANLEVGREGLPVRQCKDYFSWVRLFPELLIQQLVECYQLIGTESDWWVLKLNIGSLVDVDDIGMAGYADCK
ncbi:hypothetical protein [Laribacter hongkongensis]|uniref:Uncharacterized protein n=1 Tax=Laribacter hongkongensis TaxID=168471 RepID=A0A248LGW9_9NEIS|nr:hypothetical protein [Laribacter hongkongensis]ASJ24018.1 hypothetical protein LHGZ1_1187 [Laribacter hongkongensis]MCG9041027.1 hypothetical protein [Laribacter hongkongensis]MCG9066486.1 hypothetical protein [Laribacter hongkongensis]MCG9089011.1 hypothetical protein [Laribacter hongkongensis]MCG9108767.1 hypothetical protein [Laribacter hongkongensis]